MYGPHDKYDLERSHVFGATITKVMTNTTGVLSVWGTGEGARDLLHVDDLVEFIDCAITKQESEYELFNVGLGSAVKIVDLIKKIISHSGKELQIDWEPKISIDEGIIKTIEWYKENSMSTEDE